MGIGLTICEIKHDFVFRIYDIATINLIVICYVGIIFTLSNSLSEKAFVEIPPRTAGIRIKTPRKKSPRKYPFGCRRALF